MKAVAMFRFLLVLAVLAGGCSSPAADDAESITVGLLLPFTGTDSATSSNFERAVLYARDRINEGGGPKGRHIRIVSADTHSDVARAKQSASPDRRGCARRHRARERGESPRRSNRSSTSIRSSFFHRSLAPPMITTSTARRRGFGWPHLLVPSAKRSRKQVIAASLKSAAVLHSDGAYDQALRQAFENRFAALAAASRSRATLFRDAQSYLRHHRRRPHASQGRRDLAVDVASLGALFVNELAVYNPRPKLFLSPLLKTDLLLQNAAPEALEGAMGVAPKIFDTSDKFPQAFGARWLGDQPLEGAFFYYDALAMIAFALERSDLSDGRFEADRVRAAIFAGTGPVRRIGSMGRDRHLAPAHPRR